MIRTLAQVSAHQPKIAHLMLWLMLTIVLLILAAICVGLARWLRRNTLRPLNRPGSPAKTDNPPVDPWSESARRIDTDEPEK